MDRGICYQGTKLLFWREHDCYPVFVVAKCDGDVRMFIVEADANGVSRELLATVDSRGYANVHFSSVRLTEENVIGGADEMQAVLDRARAGLAAEMLGTGCQAFDMTLEYLKTRVQFGQVIGSFQALGHRAAELFSQMSCLGPALKARFKRLTRVVTTSKKCRLCQKLGLEISYLICQIGLYRSMEE